MLVKPTAVSIRADPIYKAALKILARRMNKAEADLVREALDQVYLEQLQPYINFFTEIDNKISQSE